MRSVRSSVQTHPRTVPTPRALRWEDEQQAAHVLARAFVDDPLVVAICGADGTDRARRMWWSFRVALRSHCRSGQPAWCITDGADALHGVVLVTQPNAQVGIGGDVLFAVRGFLRVGIAASLRGIEAANVIATHEPRQPFTYLRTIGVEPSWQGYGLGSALIRQVVRAAARSLPIYLETSKEENLAFYARNGFQRCGEFRCVGVPLWRLMRSAEC